MSTCFLVNCNFASISLIISSPIENIATKYTNEVVKLSAKTFAFFPLSYLLSLFLTFCCKFLNSNYISFRVLVSQHFINKTEIRWYQFGSTMEPQWYQLTQKKNLFKISLFKKIICAAILKCVNASWLLSIYDHENHHNLKIGW